MADSPQRDLDSKMLGGCFVFVATSILCCLLVILPFFFLLRTDRLEDLARAMVLGCVPAGALGIFSARRFGIPGGAGFVGSSIATAVFLYIRIEEMFLAADAHRIPGVEYPRLFSSILPLAWFLACLVAGLLALPRGEIDEKD